MEAAGCSVRSGTIEELFCHLEFIKDRIPQKRDLCPAVVSARLDSRSYGIHIAEEDGAFRGISVWYTEPRGGYLWLCACVEERRGYGRRLLEADLRGIKEQRCAACFVKTAADNRPAISLLAGYGFRPHDRDGGVPQKRPAEWSARRPFLWGPGELYAWTSTTGLPLSAPSPRRSSPSRS